jgi:hypothetical protein
MFDKEILLPLLEHIAKFVMFKKAFEEVISYQNMVTIH